MGATLTASMPARNFEFSSSSAPAEHLQRKLTIRRLQPTRTRGSLSARSVRPGLPRLLSHGHLRNGHAEPQRPQSPGEPRVLGCLPTHTFRLRAPINEPYPLWHSETGHDRIGLISDRCGVCARDSPTRMRGWPVSSSLASVEPSAVGLRADRRLTGPADQPTPPDRLFRTAPLGHVRRVGISAGQPDER
jgi:hypothetical protein